MHLPQSQNKDVNNICSVENPVHMNSVQGGVKSGHEPTMCHVDCLFPYHMTSACVRTDPPLSPFIWLVAYST